jgi:hypothetical protein
MLERLQMFLSRTEVWVGAIGLVAFLGLYWALRGAPIGQAVRDEDEEDEAPAAGYRDRVVLAMVGGLLLVLAGGYLAVKGRLLASLPAFALGLGIVVALIVVNRRYRHGSPSMRRTIELAGAMLNVGLIAGILIVANILAFRFGGRALDLTRERTFTLSSLTVNQLRALKRPVTVTIVFGRGARAQQQLESIQQMLDLFKAANPERVAVNYVNPFVEHERIEALTRRYPEVGVTQGGSLLIEYGEGSTADHVLIRGSDLFDDARGSRFEGSTVQFETGFKGEDAVTTALMRLREGKRTKLALITGHGEPPSTEHDPRREGLGVFRSRLASLGYEVVEVNLLREAVPPDVALVAVVGPKAPYGPDEAAKLKAVLAGGTPVLAVVGGPESPGEKTGLEDLLRSYNLAVGPGVVVDPSMHLPGQVSSIVVPITVSVRHPLVDPLVNRAVLMPRSAPIRMLTPAEQAKASVPFNPSILPASILRTSPRSWVETDLKGRSVQRSESEEMGPLTVGVAVADRPRQPQQPGAGEPKPRLVLFSSRFLADNFCLEVEQTANLDLLVNAISWLRGQAELGGIAPKTHVALTLAAEPLLRFRLIMVPTVMSALLIIGLGLTTYLARRE